MTGRAIRVQGSLDLWMGGSVTSSTRCILAPNPSAMTLEGTNTWLLGAPGSSRTVVVDPGPDEQEHLDAIADTAAGTVAEILLTHGHADHSAGARSLAQRLGVRVRAMDPQHQLGSEGLVGGDVLDLGEWVIEVVATPGHSTDSLCFVIPHEGAILTGDTVLGRGPSVVDWPNGNLRDYLDSLRLLRDVVAVRNVGALLPGHGPALSDPGGVIDAYLEHRSLRLSAVQAALDSGIREPLDIVRRVYADVPEAAWPYAEMSVRAQLEYLSGL